MSRVLPFGRPVAIVDVETTGGSHAADRVIEIGVLRIESDGAVSTFSSLINPERSLPPWITNLTGIRPEELQDAPVFADVAMEVSRLLHGALFIAHNAPFDHSFVKAEFGRLEMPFAAVTLCSARLSKSLYPEHRYHDLSTLVERFGLEIAHRHRALDDAKAVLDLMERALADKGEAAFTAACEKVSKDRRILPRQDTELSYTGTFDE